MWLHVPLAFCPSSPVAAHLIWPSDSLCQTLERSATWKGNSLPPASWQRALHKDLSTTPLSGLTCEPSMLDAGVDRWIASLADSPAKISPSPAAARESSKETEAGYGSNLPASFARFDPASSSWKTSAQSLFEESTPFSETWPRSGTMRSGCVFERQTWVPRTGGSGGSVWPTARSEDAQSCGNHPGAMDSPTGATAQWATPRTITGGAESGERKKELGRMTSGGGDLQSQSEQWPTPQARDWKSGDVSKETAEKNARPLNEIAERFQSSPQDPATHYGQQSSPNIPTSRQRLNPGFVAWLMGLPWWWTHAEPIASAQSETASWLSRARRLLESF